MTHFIVTFFKYTDNPDKLGEMVAVDEAMFRTRKEAVREANRWQAKGGWAEVEQW